MKDMKDKIVWFRGERVRLTGEVRSLYGGEFYVGVYLTGTMKGTDCLVEKSFADKQIGD